MKTTLKLLLAVTIAVFCGSNVKAQGYSQNLVGGTLIYSNAFNGSGSINITNTPANFEAGILGGSSNTNWVEGLGSADTNALHADGTMGTGQGNSWLLPFVPQVGFIYTLNVTLNFVSDPGASIGAGFASYHGVLPANGGNARFNTGGIDWAAVVYSSQNLQAFAGPNTVLGFANVNGLWGPPPTGNHTLTMVLDTTAAKWVCSCYFDGIQGLGGATTNYATNPSILGLGLEQNGASANLNNNSFTWRSLILAADTLVLTKNPVSAGVSLGTAFTNTVVVSCSNPGYQWYTNGVAIGGATTNILVYNPVTAASACPNIYVIVTNSTTSVTSAPVSLTVYASPAITTAFPVTYTSLNQMTLYGATTVGGTNYPGSTPSFSVSALGQAPLTYQWQTNGVNVGGATSVGFTFTNCPLTGPTNFACVVANGLGTATNTWLVSYLPAPMASFTTTIMSFTPAGFWRLNETPDDGNGDQGLPALDYASGNNGLYLNAEIGHAGYTNVFTNGASVLYNNTDTSDASVRFNFFGSDSEVQSIQGLDFAATNGASATFTVQAMVKGGAQVNGGACIIAKGPVNGEQFALDVNGNKWRFLYRNTSGAVSAVTAATGPDGFWHLVVGAVDQINGNISLYVDGLTVGSAAVTPGVGVFSLTNSITIGARASSPGDHNESAQFDGYISDVVAYKRALTAGQVAQIYATAGGTVKASFVVPLTPTNYVFLGNTTISIPATFFGPPPMGYIWTNVTTGGTLQTGQTNIFGNMDATLTILNASTNLSGDVFELIVTNATTTTNLFVTLFSPQPPIALDYSNTILYSNYFNGGTWSISGMQLTAANLLVGGLNTTWINTFGGNTGKLQGSGISATASGDSWLLPFKPQRGYVYTVSASVSWSGQPGSWVGIGFAQGLTTNATVNGAFNSSAVNGYAFEILTPSTANVQAFRGPSTAGQCVNTNAAFAVPPSTNIMTVILDTTSPTTNWIAQFIVNGIICGQTNYPANNLPVINAVGMQQNALASPQFIKWNYFSVTQVAPNGGSGGSPYLLNPSSLPASISVGAGTALSIPVTAFGAVPIGYSWSNTNTATVLGSGTTNTLAPLGASLTVASVPGSWNGNTLSLVLTNAFGTNISLILLNVTNSISLNPTNIVLTVTNGSLFLTWPADHVGYTLQAQTNSAAVGISTNWVDVPASTTTNQIVVPINPANGDVFYRLYLNH